MSKKIVIGLGIIILAVVSLFVLNKKAPNSTGQNPQNLVKKEISVDTDICAEFPKEWASSALGKAVTKTDSLNRSGTAVCDYYVDDSNFAAIRVNNLSAENQKKGQESLGRTIKTDSRITMEHFIVWQSDGLINGIYLVLNPNKFIAIDRTSSKVFDNEGEIAFAVKVAQRIQRGENITSSQETTTSLTTAQNTVPLPQGEDIVRNFFNLINEGKISEAVNMLTPMNISDDSNKQAWGVQFNAFEKITVKKIEKGENNTYKVNLDVKMKPGTENVQPMPYYGWGNGEFVRWIPLEKINNVWRIGGIATGP
jgi:hypothetical protein